MATYVEAARVPQPPPDVEPTLASGPEQSPAAKALGEPTPTQEGFGAGLLAEIRRRQHESRAAHAAGDNPNYPRLELTKPSAEGPAITDAADVAMKPEGDTADSDLATGGDIPEPEELRSELEVLERQLAEAVAEIRRERELRERAESEVGNAAAALAKVEGEFDDLTRQLADARALAASVARVERGASESGHTPRAEADRPYLEFAPGAAGYEISEHAGTPPELGAFREINGVELQVVKIARSPLPDDHRPCVYLAA